jgi:gluconolactonase
VITKIGAAAGARRSRPVLLQLSRTPCAARARHTAKRHFQSAARFFPASHLSRSDIIVIDPSFNALRTGNTAIHRLWTGAQWCEGPAWCGQGQYLVWSDIPNNRQMRFIEEDGRVTVFRQPSGNSNGNTFDHQGRQLSCEHSGRRVVRYEHDGSITVIADCSRANG